MDKEAMLFFACCIILLVAVAVAVFLRVRRMLREKDKGIMQSIREQMRLSRELERTRIEKETIEKIVSARSDGDDVPPASEEQANTDQL